MSDNTKQLYKKSSDGSYPKIFPLAFVQGIKDKRNDKELLSYINEINHFKVDYVESPETTRCQVDNFIRKKGLYITYYNTDINESVTEYFKGNQSDVTDDNIWGDSDNWELVPDKTYIESHAVIPNKSITMNKLADDVVQAIGDSGLSADEEDLTDRDSILKFKDRKYNIEEASGLGYKILRKNWVGDKNILTQDMISDENTIYEIKYDFDLNGEEITVPENCILSFKGGNLNNGTVFGQNTIINSFLYTIFNNIILSGSFVNSEWDAEWFGVSKNILNNDIYINYGIEQLSKINGGTLIINNNITISDTIYLLSGVSIIGKGTNKPENLSTRWAGSALIKCAFSNKNKWIVSLKPNQNVEYNVFDIAGKTNERSAGIKIENLYFLTVSEDGNELSTNEKLNAEAIFGGIRTYYFENSLIKNVTLIGVKYGLAFSNSWCSSIDNCQIFAKISAIVLTSTITTLYFNQCRFRYDIYFNEGEINFDPSLFRDSELLIPSYLTESDIKTVGLVANNNIGHYGPNIDLNACTFEAFDIAIIACEGVWTLNHFYAEAIQKTIIWGISAKITILNEAYDIWKGVPIVENGFEYGGKDSYFVMIGSFGVARCYPGENCFYSIKSNNPNILSFYDTFFKDENDIWNFIKNPNKKIILDGIDSIYVSNSTNINPPSENNLITGKTSIGVKPSNSVVTSEVISRINELTQNKIVYIKFRHNRYDSWGTDIIKNKDIIIIPDSKDEAYIYFTPLLKIEDSNVIINEDKQIQSTGSFFLVSGKCKIDIFKPVSTIGSPKTICELFGDKPVDITIIIRDPGMATIMNRAIYASNLDTFPYPIKISVYNGSTLWKTFTNTNRPTKGIPIGYVYIENGVPIYYTENGWVNANGETV